MTHDTATNAGGGQHSRELTIAEQQHEQIVNIITDRPRNTAYHDIGDLYPHMPCVQIALLIQDVAHLHVKARGWSAVPGAEAHANFEHCLAEADEHVDRFLTSAARTEAQS